MNLHVYQRSAIAAVGAARRDGKRRILLVSPTGSGKTVLLSRLTHLAVAQGKRCLWLVNRRELVAQTVRALAKFGIAAGHSGYGLMASVQVRTYQGALAAGEVPPADVLFPDEAHHLAQSGEWISIMRAYPDATVIGATATPERGDGKALDYFDHLHVVAQAADLVELWRETNGAMGLVPCVVLGPSHELKGLARTPAKATVLHRLRDHRQVVFAPHVKAAEEYCAQFREIGMSPGLVTGATPTDERDKLFDFFRRGLINPLVGCQVFTEGWDEPSVEVVTLAGRCRTVGAMIQRVGRGLRPFAGKSRCVVLDLFGVCNNTALGHPLMDRQFALTGEGISGPPVERVRLNLCKRCGAEMPDDGNTCERGGCGWIRPGLEVPKELGIKLEQIEFRRAALQKNDVDRRAEQFARWTREIGRGAFAKYRALYGAHNSAKCTCDACKREPPPEVIRHAAAIVAGRPWCSICRHSKRRNVSADGEVTEQCQCSEAE